MDEYTKEYRDHLIRADQKSQEDYDKTVISLSSGALGISFAFVKEIIGTDPIMQSWLLLSAWICWALSIGAVLSSFYFSHLSLRKAIDQTDKGKIYDQRPGGSYERITAFLNAIDGILFLVGVILLIIFVGYNLEL